MIGAAHRRLFAGFVLLPMLLGMDCSYRIGAQGTVRHGVSDAPLEGVTISVVASAADGGQELDRTNSAVDGTYLVETPVFDNDAPDVSGYEVTFQKDGFVTQHHPLGATAVEARAGRHVLDVRLQPSAGQ